METIVKRTTKAGAVVEFGRSSWSHAPIEVVVDGVSQGYGVARPRAGLPAPYTHGVEVGGKLYPLTKAELESLLAVAPAPHHTDHEVETWMAWMTAQGAVEDARARLNQGQADAGYGALAAAEAKLAAAREAYMTVYGTTGASYVAAQAERQAERQHVNQGFVARGLD